MPAATEWTVVFVEVLAPVSLPSAVVGGCELFEDNRELALLPNEDVREFLLLFRLSFLLHGAQKQHANRKEMMPAIMRRYQLNVFDFQIGCPTVGTFFLVARTFVRARRILVVFGADKAVLFLGLT